MGAAFGWGTLAACSLVIGALVAFWFHLSLRAIGLIMFQNHSDRALT